RNEPPADRARPDGAAPRLRLGRLAKEPRRRGRDLNLRPPVCALMSGLSRRRSRVRVPSLPLNLSAAPRTLPQNTSAPRPFSSCPTSALNVPHASSCWTELAARPTRPHCVEERGRVDDKAHECD